MRSTKCLTSPLSVSTSKSKLLTSMASKLKCRYGTLLDRNASKPLPRPITRAQQESSWSILSLIASPSITLKTGSNRSTNLSHKVCAKLSLVIKWTVKKPKDKLALHKVMHWLVNMESPS